MFNLGSSGKQQEVLAQAYHVGRQLGFELGYRYSNCEIGSNNLCQDQSFTANPSPPRQSLIAQFTLDFN
jgi:hypothetical protein